jgi:hypothetical protein
MAVCSSCGSEVSESSNFCTSCGQPMAKVQPAPTAASGPVCPSCGAAVEGSSAFCTGCGKRLPAATGVAAPAVAEPVAAPASAVTPPTKAQVSPFCTSCGTRLEPGIQFCTGCGAPVAAGESAPRSAAEPATEQAVATPAAAPVAATAAPHIDPVAEAVPKLPAAEPASPSTQPSYPAPAPSAHPPTQQETGGKFGLVVFILLLIIVGGVLGGWYFWGVETIVVCSPPDVKVFLDDQEIAATSYGRYVIPHLSRKTHLLKVQKPGFADTIERLDFPLTSSREWVNIRLVPSRQIRH